MGDAEVVASQVFLLLEGGMAHRGIDGSDHMMGEARRLAERLLGHEGAL